MAKRPIRIALGVSDENVWNDRFAAALDEKRSAGYPLNYDRVNLNRRDWLERLTPYDAVIWKPYGMGVQQSILVKEKVYVLEKHLHKLVIPNVESTWHFESKVAQSYLFSIEGVPTPATTATFDYDEALEELRRATFPLVFKRGEGAGSGNVWLVKSRRTAEQLWAKAFCSQIYRDMTSRGHGRFSIAARSLCKRWFWEYFRQHFRRGDSPGYLYWQEFVANNSADLRIAVIGDRYAYGFWRNNRPDDFRASGSGRIDFERPIPEECVRFCMGISRRLNFDSMAYDLLFKDGKFVIGEISYGYVDSVPYRAAGHYELRPDETIEFVPGHVWPETLWVEWALQRWEGRREDAIAK
ncbi:MAG: hypothetical protein LLG00_07940 [Planctomycetaceae bacterium]|nr:hypothetical protein [Planctomycetaceae bacterium]